MATNNDAVPLLPGLPSGKKGMLKAVVLSAYDLPGREQPIGVSLTVCGREVKTGAPSARHKENNSFKFSSNNGNNNEIVIPDVPLAELYQSVATLTVEYSNAENNLYAEVPLKSAVGVHHTQWLILNLYRAGDTNRSSSSEDTSQPTLRLQMRMEGPFRPEVAALVSLGQAWFGTVDKLEAGCQPLLHLLPKSVPFQNLVLVPTVPIATLIVAVSPIFIGLLIVGLPFFLPVLVVLGSIGATVGGIGAFLYFSGSSGRARLGDLVSPAVTTFLASPPGQRVVYETGPRPTPVTISRAVLPTDLWGKLWISLIIDCVGSSSYLLPFVGEAFDLGWAPLQTVLIMAMYDSVAPNLKYVSFIEELMPLTDVVPSATIGWLAEFGPEVLSISGKQAEQLVGILVPQTTRTNVQR